MTRTPEELRDALRALRLHGLLSSWEQLQHQPWVAQLVDLELHERARRSLENRIRVAGLGTFRPLGDFDWGWPRKLDRGLCEELMTLHFLDEGCNVVIFGPNGVGKTMLMKNLAQQALLAGHSVLLRGASDLLKDLATQESSVARARRLRAYVKPQVLCLDEVGYLSYDNTYADLLFEVVSRRYEARRPIVLTTNRTFAEWSTMFPNASSVVTLVDRLTHRCEVVTIEGQSYRLKEARERTERRASERSRAAGRRHAAPVQDKGQMALPESPPG